MLDVHELRSLIKQYDIEFKGPLTPPEWPAPYAKVFLPVREIGLLEFESYTPPDDSEERPIADMKKRAEQIVEVARRSRSLHMNESTLRSKTEHLVLSRFQAEVKCRNCRNYLWKSSFVPLRSQSLQEPLPRNERRLCNCADEPHGVDDVNRNEPGVTCLFDYCNEEPLKSHLDEQLEMRNHGLPIRRPDFVFGLSKMGSLEKHVTVNPHVKNLIHSPYPGNEILYPFLIGEAKPAFRGPAFESIEMQTAFPIRTCLKLQVDLGKMTGGHLNPLVWFLAYQSDEWRIAACIENEQKHQVIDLWMGRTTSKDGALQLLLIIDYICQWARDTFRFDILCRLAGGAENLRRQSCSTYAASSRFSVHSPRREATVDSQMTGTDPETGRSAPIVNQPCIDVPTTARESNSGSSSHQFQEFSDLMGSIGDTVTNPYREPSIITISDQSESTEERDWDSQVTYRHAEKNSMYQFCFDQFELPEDSRELVRVLELITATNNQGSLRQTAASLILGFLSPGAISTTMYTVHSLYENGLENPQRLASMIASVQYQ